MDFLNDIFGKKPTLKGNLNCFLISITITHIVSYESSSFKFIEKKKFFSLNLIRIGINYRTTT